ncbi:MAG: primosomal protein N' [Segniliparus sp.]|uniref:primosomal protein N' n=1 Tax=Segniliparus sp. TaxID=2804064 RepID=UPI003F2B354C
MAKALPVAKVLPLLGPAHLDREFDYLVAEEQDEAAQPGVRVRVRFAGRLVDGILLERALRSDHEGRLAPLHRVVSPERVLPSELRALVEATAARYAGTRGEVLRLAIPPRHARTEEAVPAVPRGREAPASCPALDGWSRYEHGAAFATALAAGRGPRGVWSALPGESWQRRFAELAAVAAGRGRTSVLVAPDHRDVKTLAQACQEVLGPRAVATITADAGPAARYGQWLAALRGQVWCVTGTRAAMFAPVPDLGLVAIWDDGDENHHEQRAPYYHAREVAILRAQESGCALLVAGSTVTPQGRLLVDSGWAHGIQAGRSEVRACAPRVTAAGESDFELERDPLARSARLPGSAFAAARAALDAQAPVLVQTPRKGYLAALSCARCRTAARCRHCHGPLAMDPAGGMRCGWCAETETNFACAACGAKSVRAGVKGAERTAEEFGRAFPGTSVKHSAGERIIDQTPSSPVLVVATPGAEPQVAPTADGRPGGYGAAILLDAWQLLDRQHLRAVEQAAHAWFHAASLVRPASHGGKVVITADASSPAVEALIRWDPWWLAEQELADRQELGFTPAVRMASVEGEAHAVERFLAAAQLPEDAEALGPVELGEDDTGVQVRMLVRAPRRHGAALSAALRAARAVVSAKGDGEFVRVKVDPSDIG